MDHSSSKAITGALIAIAITTSMDATGYTVFSALPLLPLAGLFWFLQKFSRKEIGLTFGDARSCRWALTYPVFVLGLTAAIAVTTGAIDTTATDWEKTFLNMGLMSSVGVFMVLLTEEGFFRGWLWASLKRAGHTDNQVLLWSTLAFTAWHISVISLNTGFDLPAREIPIYLINATLIGAVFGVLRMRSGSVIAPAICHAVWNGIDYPLFGFGEKIGALGIDQTHIYGPEVGILGVVLNMVFLALIWRSYTNCDPKLSTDSR